MLTITLAVFGAVDHESGLLELAILVAFVACVPTYWLMFDDHRAKVLANVERIMAAERAHIEDLIARERGRTDELIVAVAQEFAEAELPRIRMHSRA